VGIASKVFSRDERCIITTLGDMLDEEFTDMSATVVNNIMITERGFRVKEIEGASTSKEDVCSR